MQHTQRKRKPPLRAHLPSGPGSSGEEWERRATERSPRLCGLVSWLRGQVRLRCSFTIPLERPHMPVKIASYKSRNHQGFLRSRPNLPVLLPSSTFFPTPPQEEPSHNSAPGPALRVGNAFASGLFGHPNPLSVRSPPPPPTPPGTRRPAPAAPRRSRPDGPRGWGCAPERSRA